MTTRIGGPRALAAYRSTSDPSPPADVDIRILAASRAAAVRRSPLRHPLFAWAAALGMMLVLTAGWLNTAPTSGGSQDHGRFEGQSRSYLLSFDPLATGPGGQEGST